MAKPVKMDAVLNDLPEVIAEARFLDQDEALKHLSCAECVETKEDLVANLKEALAAAKAKSVRKELAKLLSRAELIAE